MSWETIVMLCNVFVVPLGGWLLKSAIGRITDRLARLEDRTKKNEGDIEQGVKREDFIRETARTRQTLERLGEGIARIEGRISGDIRIASAIERLADIRDTKAE